MDGFINLYKPIGLTSARALDRVRRITDQRKSGHAGTLDPLAEGVLVLCLGRATKLVEAVMDLPKVYRTMARLDVTSDSFDVERPLLPVPTERPLDIEAIIRTLRDFEGTIPQVPPAASAVKVAGRPAYKLLRAGGSPALRPRPVHVYWTHVWHWNWPLLGFDVACGRGTYIRALIRDIGVRLGTGGCLTSLVRLAVGPFQLRQSWSLAQLEAASHPSEYLIALETAKAFLAQRPLAIPPRPKGASYGTGCGETTGA